MLHQVFHRAVRIVNHADYAVDDFRQVVRRNVGGHADGDAVGAVHQQVRESCRQHGRLLQRFIKVGIKINGVLVDAVQQVHRQLLQPRFGITHRGGTVAVHAAEVALAFHQRITDVERLGHTHHRVVYGGVSVRVEFTEHVADHAGALAGGLVRCHAQFLGHVIQDSPVNRLQAVPDVREGPVHDNSHGVGNEAFLHLLFQIYGYQLILNHLLILIKHQDLLQGRCFPG